MQVKLLFFEEIRFSDKAAHFTEKILRVFGIFYTKYFQENSILSMAVREIMSICINYIYLFLCPPPHLKTCFIVNTFLRLFN